MARTSKTTIGSGKSDEMVRASAQGQQSVDRARSDYNQQVQVNQQQTDQMSRDIGGMLGRHQQSQQQASQFDRQMAQRESESQQQASQFDRQMAQRESDTELDAAKAGFERGGAGGDRAAKLQAEMQRGEQQQPGVGGMDPKSQERLRAQGEKPMENVGGKWVPTEERKQDQQRKNFEADTDRIKAEAYADQMGLQVQRHAIKGEREQAAELAKTLSMPVNQTVESFDRLLNAEMGKGVPKDSDWTDLEDAAKGGPDADPTLMADIQSRKFTPRVQQFARAAISREAIKYIARTGDTGNLKIDWTAPQMRQFTEKVQQMNLAAKAMGPEFSRFAGISSIEDKMAFLNTQAAMAVFMGMANAPAEDPTGGMPPSAGGPQQGGAPQGQPAPQQQRLQHTPDAAGRIEQGRRAGEARKAGNPPAPIGFPDEQRSESARQNNPSFRPGPK